MLDPVNLQKAIIRENLEGWLFFNFHHRDTFSDRFLEIAPEEMNTRGWFYLVPARGAPVAVTHAIEPGILDHLPGKRLRYSSREELESHLKPLACSCGASYSQNITALSFLDHGTAVLLESLGFQLMPSEGLIQRTMGLLSPDELAAHEEAAGHLYRIVREIWARIEEAFRENISLTERQVQEWILDDFRSHKLETIHRPIVGAGPNSGNPHYEPGENSRILGKNEIIQFDLWAKLPGPGGVFADISWVGFLGHSPSKEAEDLFELVCRARDTAVEYIRSSLQSGSTPRGRDVDEITREVIRKAGKSRLICHRTGHAIDREIHGWGVNMDSTEFPDNRPLLEGSCFSIEPGLYGPNFGCRTEINACVYQGDVRISGGPIQNKLLVLG